MREGNPPGLPRPQASPAERSGVLGDPPSAEDVTGPVCRRRRANRRSQSSHRLIDTDPREIVRGQPSRAAARDPEAPEIVGEWLLRDRIVRLPCGLLLTRRNQQELNRDRGRFGDAVRAADALAVDRDRRGQGPIRAETGGERARAALEAVCRDRVERRSRRLRIDHRPCRLARGRLDEHPANQRRRLGGNVAGARRRRAHRHHRERPDRREIVPRRDRERWSQRAAATGRGDQPEHHDPSHRSTLIDSSRSCLWSTSLGASVIKHTAF